MILPATFSHRWSASRQRFWKNAPRVPWLCLDGEVPVTTSSFFFDPVLIFWASLHVISRHIASSSGLVLAQLCQSTNKADVFLSHPSAENNLGFNKPK